MLFIESVNQVHQPASRFVKVRFYVLKIPRQPFEHGAVSELSMSTRIGPPAPLALQVLLILGSRSTGLAIITRALTVVQTSAAAMPKS